MVSHASTMKRFPVAAAIAGVSLALAACGTGGGGPETAFLPPRTAVSLADTDYPAAVETANSLALDMLAASDEANTVVSPASLSIALGMLAEGATDEGVTELAALLGVEGDDRTQTMAALLTSLSEFSDGEFSLDELPEEPFLRVANNAMIDDELEIRPEYVERLEEYYGATAQQTDLGSAEGKELLDQWVAAATEGLIEESAIEPDPTLRLVLQNALLFAAKWAVPFEEGSTYEEAFTRADGTAVDIPMMHNSAMWRYGEAGEHRGIALPYTEGFTAYVVLPPAGEKPDPDAIRNAIAATVEADPVSVRLALPTFDLASTTDVKDYLEGIGITHIFENPMSLRGIADQDLLVSAIVQQGRLIVDEAGTMGAAVTEIAVTEAAAPVDLVDFRADRPFYLAVHHDETGLGLFQAWVGDPSAD